MTRNTRILLTAFVIALMAVGVLVYQSSRDRGAPPQAATADAGQLVRDNSHRLSSVPDSAVTFVEFLDFECEGCRAVHPAIEQLRSEYGGRVNFVIRHFPMSGHFNGERAARAVEAAAQQGKFEAMYKKMFETQGQWGEKQTPADEVFRTFAAELGLDMTAFDKAYRDPATAARVQLDVADGRALGVPGPPTFFLNGSRIQPHSLEDLSTAFDKALAE